MENSKEVDETIIKETLIQYGVNIKDSEQGGETLYREILEITKPTIKSFSLNESFDVFSEIEKEKFELNISPLRETERKETKFENLRKKRKQLQRNEIFSPIKQQQKKTENKVEVPLFEEKIFKYEKEEELKNFSFNISPLKPISTNTSPKSTKKINTDIKSTIISDKKESTKSKMKLPTSINRMKDKSKIPIKKDSNLKTLHGKERLNLKGTAIPFETKWKKYLQK